MILFETKLLKPSIYWTLFRKGGDEKSATSHRNVANPTKMPVELSEEKQMWKWTHYWAA